MLKKPFHKIKLLCYTFMARMIAHPRRWYYRWQQRRLCNNAPTIIANNCYGGMIYHNLGLQFRSPTINLYFNDRDFISFVRNLPDYLQAELSEVTETDKPWPVGALSCGDEKVILNFMHYESFAEAKEKWYARRERVDFSNLYILMQSVYIDEDIAADFDNLPYENKILIAANNPSESPNTLTFPILSKSDYRPGEILEYASVFSVRRNMDKFDYVHFLNRRA